jgi:hypothetical protein
MDNKEKEFAVVPYFLYEEEKDTAEKDKERLMLINKRLWITIGLLIISIVGLVVGGIIYESQYDKITYTQDGEGVNNVNLGEQGDITNEPNSNGKTETETHNP